MEHAGGEAGEAGEGGAPEMQPHAAARSLSAPSKPSPRLYLGWLLLRVILEVFCVNWEVTKTMSIPFLHLTCAKWHAPDIAGAAGRAPEAGPQKAAQSTVPHD